ncbi:MAG: GntR family transcriptional regulator [Pseudomonadota bacterium]
MADIRLVSEIGGKKAHNIYSVLRSRIISLELPPGEAIRKEALSDEFGVSRAPINEALARLRDEELVQIVAQHGSFVAPIEPAKVFEGIFARRTLEPATAARAAAEQPEGLLAALDENIEAQSTAVKNNDPERMFELDDAFHGLIMEAVGLSQTRKFLLTFGAHVGRARNKFVAPQDRLFETLAEHKRIVEAIRDGDMVWSESEMQAHLASAYKVLVTALRAETEAEALGEGVAKA